MLLASKRSLCFLIVCLKIFPLLGVTLVEPKSLPCMDKIPSIIYIILLCFTLFYIILHDCDFGGT